jgi:DNA-binding PadR family transcriptional regulator
VTKDFRFSVQTLSVLAALSTEPVGWRHGYGIAKDTGLKSGSLYPILIRLAERGLVEARWEEEQPAGRPRRHLYRLTPDGLAKARAALAGVPSPARARPGNGPSRNRRVAPQGASWTN